MKTYQNNDKTKQIWYDNHLKLWTLQILDEGSNQKGDVEYAVKKEVAFYWLNFPNRTNKYA